ncbi:MAG: hypothetical protein IPG81_25315 [Sandaracinaceae bacterium]|nr:hypothetical protein [Sandaracinaceae bacterium]
MRSRSRWALLGSLVSVVATIGTLACLRRTAPLALPGVTDPGMATVDGTEPESGGGDDQPIDFLPRIDSSGDWARLATRPESHVVAHTETVKFVIDMEADDRVYFLQSERWDLHFAFVQHFIDPRADHGRFNISEYRRDDRRFLLGSLMHYQDGDHFTLELVAGDTMSGERIAKVFALVRGRVYFGDQLRFRPISPLHERSIAGLGNRVPVLPADAVNASVRYQPLVLGVAFGVLRIVRGELDPSSVRPNEILVTETVPEEMPPVSALVTSQLQAPLAHVAVLSRNRNTPDMALRGAADLPEVQALEGRIVRLSVGAQEYTLREANRSDAEAAWAAARPSQPFRPTANTQLRTIRPVCGCEAEYAGAKAAQLSELCALGGLGVPPGFVVPFAEYAAHLARVRRPTQLRAMLQAEPFRTDASERARQLAALREAMAAAPVDPRLLTQVRAQLTRLGRSERYIFRSSTNAEDLAGFNGAGLYESIVVPGDASPEVVANALRRVWASVWLQRAYEERDWFRIAHDAVAMAVLVQPFVANVVANGVAITRNPYDEARPGVFINTQVTGATVTGAQGNELPEQFLVYHWAEELEPELLSRSSMTGGAPILSEAEVMALTHQLMRIHNNMAPRHAGMANAMDVEFLLTRDRRFVFVQARPFNVVYAAGQRWRTP